MVDHAQEFLNAVSSTRHKRIAKVYSRLDCLNRNQTIFKNKRFLVDRIEQQQLRVCLHEAIDLKSLSTQRRKI